MGGTGKTGGGYNSGSGGYKFPAQQLIYVAVQGGAVISTVSFHASCSYPILTGEQFGSMNLVGFANSAGISESNCALYTGSISWSNSGGGVSLTGYGGYGGYGYTGKSGKGHTGKSKGKSGKGKSGKKNYGYSYSGLDTISSNTLGTELSGAKEEFAEWIRTAGCAVANDDMSQIIWTSNFNPSQMNNVFCGQKGTVVFTATDKCGKSTDVTGTYQIQKATRTGADQ